MPITSLIVRTQTNLEQTIADQICELPGASVTDVKDEALIAITETENRDSDRLLWEQMENIPGVSAVDVIYHNFEDMEV